MIFLSCLLLNGVLSQCAIRCNSAQGYFLDDKACKCVKRPPMVCFMICEPGYRIESPCNCVKIEPVFCIQSMCPDGSNRNPVTCKCPEPLPPVLCIASVCPNGKSRNPRTCKCPEPVFCIQSMCPDGSSRDPETCQCPKPRPPVACIESLCPNGKLRDPKTCGCPEPIFCIQSLCPDGSSRDPETCGCPKPIRPPFCIQSLCPRNQKRDPKDCRCKPIRLCKRLCPLNQILNEFCECIKQIPVICKAVPCPFGSVRRKGSCECVPTISFPPIKNCLIKSCKNGFKLDENCRCVEKQGAICEIGCPLGTKVYVGICDCVPVIKCPIQFCQNGFKQDNNCRCVKGSFPLPILTPKVCQIQKCKRHYLFDKKNCKCELPFGRTCRRACPRGKVMISPCKCVKKKKCPIKKCRHNWEVKKDTCECIREDSFFDLTVDLED